MVALMAPAVGGKMQVPYIQTDSKDLSQIQTKWRSVLNPLLAAPMVQVKVLKGIKLKNGINNIDHLLQQTMQGWFITDIDGAATIYRSAPLKDLTLTLTSNASVTVNLAVF
jgi:hypothetical protein